MPRKRQTKRGIWVVGIVVGTWCAVNVAIPRVSDGHGSIIFYHAWAGLRAHVLSVCEGYETFGDLTGSATLQSVAKTEIRGNRYILKVLSGGSGAPAAVIAYPKKHWGYKYGLLRRILTLEMEKDFFPTLLLTLDGSLYANGSRHFDASNMPPDNVLENFPDSGEWHLRNKYPTTPPCSAPKPERVGG